MSEQKYYANFYQSLLAHLHIDCIAELDWIASSFSDVKFPVFKEEEMKEFNKIISQNPFLQAANAFFTQNPNAESYTHTYENSRTENVKKTRI